MRYNEEAWKEHVGDIKNFKKESDKDLKTRVYDELQRQIYEDYLKSNNQYTNNEQKNKGIRR